MGDACSTRRGVCYWRLVPLRGSAAQHAQAQAQTQKADWRETQRSRAVPQVPSRLPPLPLFVCFACFGSFAFALRRASLLRWRGLRGSWRPAHRSACWCAWQLYAVCRGVSRRASAILCNRRRRGIGTGRRLLRVARSALLSYSISPLDSVAACFRCQGFQGVSSFTPESSVGREGDGCHSWSVAFVFLVLCSLGWRCRSPPPYLEACGQRAVTSATVVWRDVGHLIAASSVAFVHFCHVKSY